MDPWIIDLGPYFQSGSLSTSEDDMNSLGKSLVEGFSQGAVYVKNSGIPLDKVTTTQDFVTRFLALPPDIKQKYKFGSKAVWNGYGQLFSEWLGKEIGQPRSYRETYNFAMFREKWAPDSDPDEELPGFTEAWRQAGMPFIPLSKWVLQCMALAMGLKRDAFDSYLKGIEENSSVSNFTQLKLNYSPPIDEGVDLSKVMRCGEHIDGGLITWDVMDSVGGLQVKRKDGTWVDVPPIADTIVLMPSEMLGRLLADRIPAAVHQVAVTNREMAKQSRWSFIVDVLADTDTVIQPIDGSTRPPLTNQRPVGK